jgi:hypothetical protein
VLERCERANTVKRGFIAIFGAMSLLSACAQASYQYGSGRCDLKAYEARKAAQERIEGQLLPIKLMAIDSVTQDGSDSSILARSVAHQVDPIVFASVWSPDQAANEVGKTCEAGQ